eukprot:CAMPEP_0113276662 /NCGR_PEP_ID=MMETSP0008_2-20120614/25613_1 /TAXON_ID=97485 /ORGANISM="Prymnesium parvum" /LENGTH=48 /DNA_ID=CAMNT_0000126479 /DNA_START=193 /DNA_END=339 /DNA_ORIENTATION=+ /assembly_acc=CAM_ASM_000153
MTYCVQHDSGGCVGNMLHCLGRRHNELSGNTILVHAEVHKGRQQDCAI